MTYGEREDNSMTKREKLYGWIIVAAFSIPSIIAGLGRKYISVSRYGVYAKPGFYFFALAVPVILIIAWLWIQERVKKK